MGNNRISIVEMNTCRGCLQTKNLTDFYRHAQMGDEHLNYCRACVRARVSKHRAENLERIQAYDRGRGQLEHRKTAVAARAPRYASAQAGSEWGKRNRQKTAAQVRLRRAVKKGIIAVQLRERCGYGIGVQAHHEDYSKPLDVIWLCTKRHGERHREINADRRKSATR